MGDGFGISGNALSRPLDPARLKDDPAALRKVAQEMESMFAYEMIKAMKATGEMAGKGLGGDSYMTLFQMELSKVMAQRGLGMQDMLERGLASIAEKNGQGPPGPAVGSAAYRSAVPAARSSALPDKQPRPGTVAPLQDSNPLITNGKALSLLVRTKVLSGSSEE